MSRFKELKEASLPIGIAASIMVGAAAIVASGEAGNEHTLTPVKNYPRSAPAAHRKIKDEQINVVETQSIDPVTLNFNLEKSIDWLDSINDPALQSFVNELRIYQDEVKAQDWEHIDIVASGNSAKNYASVIPSISPSGTKLKIVLAKDKFSSASFNIQEAAIDLFQAQITLNEANHDPKRYGVDKNYRDQIHKKALEKTREIFKDIVPRQSAVV